KSIIHEVSRAAPPGAPNVILINITEREHEGVRKLLEGWPGLKHKPTIEPLVAVRLEAIDGRPVKDLKLEGFARRFQSTREVTWADAPPADLRALRGAWWKASEASPQVAVVEEMATVLKLKPGQRLTWTAIGRKFETPIAAVFGQRAVRASQQVEMLFNRPALAGLPVQYIGLARLPGNQVGALQRTAYEQFPTVTVINSADLLNLVQEV